MATASFPMNSDGPLGPQHHEELLSATQRAKKVRSAAGVAAFNGWSIGAIAVLSLPFAFSSFSALVVELGLAVIAFNEFRGRDGLLRFDPRAAVLLGWNQVGLMSLLVGYSLWSIYLALVGPTPYDSELLANPELESVLGPIGELFVTLTLAVYGGVILGTVLFQGSNAWYYFTRGKHVRAYLDSTPAWVVDLQRTGAVK